MVVQGGLAAPGRGLQAAGLPPASPAWSSVAYCSALPSLPMPTPRPHVLPSPSFPANSASLELDYLDLAGATPVVAIWLADLPKEVGRRRSC